MAVLTSGLVVFTSFTWLIGLASSLAEASVFRLVSGFGEGVFWSVAMASVATYFKQWKALALGIFYVGFDFGTVAGLGVGGLAAFPSRRVQLLDDLLDHPRQRGLQFFGQSFADIAILRLDPDDDCWAREKSSLTGEAEHVVQL